MNALASMLTLILVLVSLWALIVNPSLSQTDGADPQVKRS